ncbi:MAG: hypothetical protein JW741_23170 [Sedimentisphaerales bacterium]|nr:hypothetical protein [Sedimentisphaerales bacterium]
MTKKKAISIRIDEDHLQALYGLAGTFGVTPEQVIQQALPDIAETRLFFQCKDYLPELRWDDLARASHEAIREHLRAMYTEGLEQHLARFGITLESSPHDVETAKKRALDELRSDRDHPLAYQLARAEADSVYLGCLYDAWKRARESEPGYTIAQVNVEACAPGGPAPHKAWAVLKDDKIV